jgi:hypothetical protein
MEDAEVTRLPLENLIRCGRPWGTRQHRLTPDDLQQMLRRGRVEFVTADVGSRLRWVDPNDCFRFWKDEVKPHLADTDRFYLEQYPSGYCYTASQWGLNQDGIPIVVLELAH